MEKEIINVKPNTKIIVRVIADYGVVSKVHVVDIGEKGGAKISSLNLSTGEYSKPR